MLKYILVLFLRASLAIPFIKHHPHPKPGDISDGADQEEFTKPINGTHVTHCKITPKHCVNKNEEKLDYDLKRESWWVCNQSPSMCINKLLNDINLNLESGHCKVCNDAVETPKMIKKLEHMVTNLKDDEECGKFGDKLGLLSNIVIIKSRYCHLDLNGLFTIFDLYKQLENDCSNETSNETVNSEGGQSDIDQTTLDTGPSNNKVDGDNKIDGTL